MGSTEIPKKMMQLNIIDNTSTGSHMAIGQWKDPKSFSRHKDRLDYYVWLAQTAEKGKITSIFFADLYGVHETYGGSADATFQGGAWVAMLDPVVLISAMAQATKSVSFAVTGSTSYLSPYAVARTWSSLDHVTNGRIGFNVVTSFGKSPAKCFGIDDAVPHDERYLAAEEFMDIVYRIWEQSWEDGAQVWSSDPEMAYDPSKIHKIEYNGKYHKFSGFGQTHPSPQRTPVVFQAGQSKTGVTFAGKHAEGIYCGVPTIEGLRKYSKSVREAAVTAGRDPSSVKLFCGICPIVGRTEEEALAKHAKYKANTSFIGGLSSFCALTGVDLSKYALDEPFNFEDEELAKAGIQGIFNNFKLVEKDKAWTPRMVGEKVGFGGFGPMPVGTPEQVADVMEKWFIEGDVDGFNIQYMCNPESIEDLVELLIPELQRRGIYWKDYDVPAGTLRENMQRRPGQSLLPPDHPGAKLRSDPCKPVDKKTLVNDNEQPILELCKRRLNDGLSPTHPSVKKALPEVRINTKCEYVYYSSIEEPSVFFMLGMWPSMNAYNSFRSSPGYLQSLEPLGTLSTIEWIEHMEFDSLSSLPIEAPVMTVTRAFLKPGDHPKEYYRKISDLKGPIEAETAPHPCVFSWTVDTTPECHKWLMFVGWQSKWHHRGYAAMLRETNAEFPSIPDHYDEGTMHMHTWNMERGPRS